jgi:myo-inositol catabolism protein IolC
MATDLFILAMDHRDSLAKQVYGIQTEPTAVEAERIAGGKLLVFRGLLAALDRGADPAVTGVLVDERYGAAVAHQVREAGLRLAMPIEESGQDFFTLEYGRVDEHTWLDHVDRFAPDYVKVLVRDNPDFDPVDRRGQQERLAIVSAALHDAHRTSLFELLVPPTDEQHDRTGNDYDARLRPQLTEQVIADFQAAGVEPDIWKIEGLEDATAARNVVATTQGGGRDSVRCIVLGRDAPVERLDHWLEIAAGTPGFEGFAIGRSIWEQPLADHLAGRLDEDRAIEAVATNYLHFVQTYRGVS